MTNRTRVVLYIGITNSLERRRWHHLNTDKPTFTKRYSVDRLVYYESYNDPRDAISREKKLKGYRREKKVALIEGQNPRWEDLGAELFGYRKP
jgi:putative endonuclease